MRYAAIERHARLFSEYTELRVQENRNSSIALVKGNVVANQAAAAGGVSARVHKDGVWGFASDPILSDEAIGRVVETATRNAIFLAGKEGRSGHGLPRKASSTSRDLSTPKPRVGQKGLMDFVRTLDAQIAERYSKLLSRTVSVRCLDMEKTLLTSEGASAYSMTPRAILYVVLSMDAGGEPVEVMKVFGGRGQFEDRFGEPSALAGAIDELYGHLARKAEGVHPDAGVHEALLGPDLAGILAHEAIGHTVEGDCVLGGSVAADYMGRKVASELVTLVDFAHEALGETCPVPLWTDDEGTEARDAVLIDRGVLRSYMHSKETAAKFGHEPTGNARASGFHDEPLVRMRNTAILPGKSALADMIAGLDEGYYFMRPSNGQADSTSEFMFGVTLGYEVRKGKLGRALRDTTISGVAFDMLKTVTAVSSDMTWTCGGMCGKKQLIPVGMGGPAIRCRINVGGR
jgi:TldD protein